MSLKIQKTILIVEDDIALAEQTKKILQRFGYIVQTVNSGEAAVELFKESNSIDLILMDIDLGEGMDGTQAAEIILKAIDIPVVFLSSHTESEIVEKTEKITSYGYVVKGTGIIVADAAIKMAFKLFDAKKREFEKEKALCDYRDKLEILVKERTAELEREIAERRRAEEVLRESESRYRNLVDNSTEIQKTMSEEIKHLNELNAVNRRLKSEIVQRRHLEEKYRLAMEAANDGVWDWDLTTGEVYYSPAYYKMLGIEDNIEFKNTPEFWIDLLHPDDRENVLLINNECIDGKYENFSVEYRMKTKSGKWLWILGRGKSILRDESGRCLRMIGTHTDITSSRLAQEALRQRESHLAAIFENQPGLLWLKDIDGRLLMVNKKYAQSCGFDNPELISGKTDFDIWPHELASNYIDDDKKVIESGKSYIVEEPISINGESCWFETFKTPVFDGPGKIIGTTGYARDITDRKKAEEALIKSEELFKAFVHNGPALTMLTDETGRVTYMSPQCESVLGHPAQKFIGVVMPDIIHPDDIAACQQVFEQVFKYGRQVIDFEYRIIDGKGFIRWISHNAGVVKFRGNITAIQSLIYDITSRKAGEEKIKNLLAEKEIMLKEVHHRIKNNMNIISSILFIQMSTLKDSASASALKDAIGRVQSMMVLYDKLYRSDDFKDLSLREYIWPIVDEIIDNFPNKAMVKIIKNIDDAVIDSKIFTNLGIIINEIITNIMKYAFKGRKEGVITLSAAVNNNRMKLIIEDDGIGMPESFDDKSGGGFGLELVAMMARSLRGTIRFDRDNGTKFILDFIIDN